MFNSGFRGKRANDNQGIISQPSKFVQIKNPQPYISGYAISGSDDTALNPAGGQTVLIDGTGFVAGISATLGGTQIASVTLVSPTQISFTSPANAGGSYSLVVYNSSGGAAILVPGLTYSSVPTYTTNAGSIGSYYETTAISTQVVATSDSSLTYTLASGSLPSGATLNSNGTITGTSPVDSSSTTYTFAITATDAELQDVTRTFTLTINTDVVTWVSPADNQSYTLAGNQEMSSVTLSATSAAGSGVTYTANALPTGLTLSSGIVSGTPTVSGTTSTLFTATATTTTRTATRTVSWTVTLGDDFWENVSLLLNGSTPTTTFINDASLNNSQLTIAGDTKPNNFNPYTQGYYSTSFNSTSGDVGLYLGGQANFAFGTGDFTIEMWVNLQSVTDLQILIDFRPSATQGLYPTIYVDTLTSTLRYFTNNADRITGATVFTYNIWHHVAVSRSGSNTRLFLDGVQQGSTYNDTNNYIVGANRPYTGYGVSGSGYKMYGGYLSNLRIVKQQALYTTLFTPPTAPLTAIANTVLLTAQSNRIIDNSVNNYTITVVGDVSSKLANPFATPTTATYNTLYSTYFDGATGDYINVANATNLQPGTGDFTYEFWFYPTNLLSIQEIVCKGFGLQIYMNGTALSVALSASNSGTYFVNTSVGTLANNTWYHIALVRSGNNYYGYINGTRTTLATSASSPDTGTDSLFIGAFGTITYYTYGVVSNFRFVKGTAVYTNPTITVPTSSLTAISGTQLLTCQDSTFKDNSSNGYTINSFVKAKPVAASPFTMTTGTTTVTSLGSTYFDGTGDYLTRGNLNFATNAFTIEGWFYPTTVAIATNFWGMDNGSGTNPKMLMYIDSSSRLTIDMGNAGSTQFPIAAALSSYGPYINQWNHIALVRSDLTSTGLKLYINGVLAGTGQLGTNLNTITANFNIGYIGEAYGNPFTGYINDFRIVNGTALYTSNFLIPQAPLTPVTNTQLLTCQYNGGANNNGFNDQSGFNSVITRNGNPTQGTFSPYSQTGWSNYYPALAFSTYAANPISSFGTGATFTVEGWVNMTIYPATNYHFSLLASCDQGSIAYWAIGVGSTGLATVYWYDGNVKQCTGSTTLAKGNWYHVAVVVTAGVVKMYVNGNVETLSGTTTLTNPTGNSSYTTGTERGSSNGGSAGYISNLRTSTTAVYPSAFTPSTTPLTPAITPSVYATLLTAQNNRFKDNSPIDRIITLGTTAPSIQAFSPFGGITSVPTSYSNYLNYADGTGDFISLPTSYSSTLGAIANSLITIEFWMFTTGISAVTGFRSGLFGNFTGSAVNGRFMIVSLGTNTTSTQTIEFTYTTSTGTTATAVTTTAIAQNLWHHVAITIDSTTPSTSTIKIYLNGVGQTFNSQNLSTHTTDPSVAFTIGSDGGGNYQQHTGYISNFRYVRGTIVYTGNFTVPTSPLATTQSSGTNIAAITGTATKLLTCQSSTVVENSNSVALTVTGTVTPKTFNPFGDTSTTLVSYTPAGNSGSIYFDGTGDFLSTATGLTYTDLTQGNFTAECWVYNQGIGAERYIYSQRGSGTGWEMRINSGNTVSFFYVSGSTFTSATTLLANTWYHIAAVRIGTAFSMYINGIKDATGSGTISNGSNASGSYGVYLGNSTSAGGGLMLGYISDARFIKSAGVYTANFVPPVAPLTAISGTSYLLNGTNGGIIDYHSNNLETVGAQLASEDPYAGSYYSNYFDGSGDYLSVPFSSAFAFPGDFTVECWIYINALPTTGSQKYIIASWDAGANKRSFYCILQESSGYKLVVGLSSDGTSPNAASVMVSWTTPVIGTWYHVAFVRSSNTVTVYVNGSSIGSGSLTISSYSLGSAVSIGADAPGLTAAYYWNGYISNLRVVKGTAIVPPVGGPTAPLTAVANTSLLTCQSNRFKDNSTNNFTITTNGDTKVKSMNPLQQNTGKSLYFDGSSGKLVIPASPQWVFGTGDFTIEFWMNTSDTGAGLITPATTGAGYWALLINSSTLYWQSAYNATNLKTASLSGYLNNAWVYVAIVRSSGTMNFYFNGVAQGSGTADSTNYSGTANTLTIGYDSAGNGYYTGYIKDLRITKGIARTITVPTTPFETK